MQDSATKLTDIVSLVNIPILWILALSVMGVVLLQSVIYMFAVKKNAAAAGMSQEEVRRALFAGGIAALGPSLAVVVVAVALLPLFGTPPVLVRIGLVGSAGTEVASASLAAGTMGAGLGDATFTREVFLVAFLAMSMSGAGWMIAALVLTPIFKRGFHRLGAGNPALLTIVPAGALLGAFFSFGMIQGKASVAAALTTVVSAIAMAICLVVAKRMRWRWLTEWGLGFSMSVGLVVAYFAHHAGLGA